MALGVHREADLRVPENVHHDARRHALHEQERRARVPQAVKLQRRKSGRFELHLRLAIQPAAVERLAVSCRKDEAMIAPAGAASVAAR